MQVHTPTQLKFVTRKDGTSPGVKNGLNPTENGSTSGDINGNTDGYTTQ